MPRQRKTRQRTVIEHALHEANHPLLPKELLAKAQASLPKLGIATVFRALKDMVTDGTAQVVYLPGDSPRYEMVRHSHHHHFKCQQCEQVFEVDCCLDNLDELVPKGFTLAHHEIALFGLCSRCSGSQHRTAQSH